MRPRELSLRILDVTWLVVVVALTILGAASAADAALTPFTPVAGINPASGDVKVVITVGATSQTLTNGSGLTCTGTNPRTCTLQTTNASCTLPSGGTAACRQFQGFDLFPMAPTGSSVGQFAVLTETNTDSVQVRNLRIVNRNTSATGPTQIKIEVTGNISANVETTAKAHGMKLVGTLFRTLKQNDGSLVSAVAGPTAPLTGAVAAVSGSYVYLRNSGTCNVNPVPASTTCQGGRTNYNSGTHTVVAGTNLANNSIKLGVPILILDAGVPSSTKCSDAFTNGTDCLDVDHTRVTVTLTLARAHISDIPANLILKCTKAPCSSVDYVELGASAAGYSGETEQVVALGTGLVTQTNQSIKPDDNGMFFITGVSNPDGVQDVGTCNCFDIFDSQNNLLVPGVTFSPGKNGIPAKAVSCTPHGSEVDFKFDNSDVGYTCNDSPRAGYVIKAFCTADITATETTSGTGNKIITTDVSGPVQGIFNGEGAIDITPCQNFP